MLPWVAIVVGALAALAALSRAVFKHGQNVERLESELRQTVQRNRLIEEAGKRQKDLEMRDRAREELIRAQMRNVDAQHTRDLSLIVDSTPEKSWERGLKALEEAEAEEKKDKDK